MFSRDPLVSVLPQVHRRIHQGIKQGLHLGAQMYVSRGAEIIADIAIGEACPGFTLTNDAIMPWMSSSKPTTVIAIMQLVERELVMLDDPVMRFIPEFGQGGKETITIRHLLTHTGGFREARFLLPDDDWDTIIARVCETPLEDGWTPGRKAGYHGMTSWFILGEIIQRVSGARFSDHVGRRIFEPLGMDDCWIGMPPDAYDRYETEQRIGALPDTSRRTVDLGQRHGKAFLTAVSPGSNGCGPMNQLARLYEMLLSGGQRDGVRILQESTVRDMTARHRVGMIDQTFGYLMECGLGLILEPQNRRGTMPYGYGKHATSWTFGHSGQQSSAAFADPSHGLAVAVMFAGMPGERPHQRRIDTLLTALYEDLELTR